MSRASGIDCTVLRGPLSPCPHSVQAATKHKTTPGTVWGLTLTSTPFLKKMLTLVPTSFANPLCQRRIATMKYVGSFQTAMGSHFLHVFPIRMKAQERSNAGKSSISCSVSALSSALLPSPGNKQQQQQQQQWTGRSLVRACGSSGPSACCWGGGALRAPALAFCGGPAAPRSGRCGCSGRQWLLLPPSPRRTTRRRKKKRTRTWTRRLRFIFCFSMLFNLNIFMPVISHASPSRPVSTC